MYDFIKRFDRTKTAAPRSCRPVGPLAALLAVASLAPSLAPSPGYAQQVERPDFFAADAPKPRVLLLGTFHFQDAGLDEYEPQWEVDVLSDERQAEIEELLGLLEAWRPTKVAVEVKPEGQVQIDSLYRAYRAGEFELPANEIFQLGFRLAARLGHERVHAVDARGRSYSPEMTREEYQARAQSIMSRSDPAAVAAEQEWNERYERLYRFNDSLKTTHSLREHLLYLNRPEHLLRRHGHYLIGSFKLGHGDDYLGPDGQTSWYNRNLRIFHHVQRITEDEDERILVIIGAGHVPILRHAVRTSPQYELVEVAEVLGEGPGD